MTNVSPISVDRLLSSEEEMLVRWLLDHGVGESRKYLAQLEHARVVSCCSCGCASIDFAINGIASPPGTSLEVLSDYQWTGEDGALFGIFVFAKAGQLAGLEVWSIDGRANANNLPDISNLTPLVMTKHSNSK